MKLFPMGNLSVNRNFTLISEVSNVPFSMCEVGCIVFHMLPILQRNGESASINTHIHSHTSGTLWLQALQYQDCVCACVRACVNGTSASPDMAGCLSVSLLRGDQGHNKLAH